jgi:hypothetical protein
VGTTSLPSLTLSTRSGLRPGALFVVVSVSPPCREIKLVFSIPPHRPTPICRPVEMWHRPIPCRLPGTIPRPKNEPRRIAVGLVPYWAKHLKVGFANINAKTEG